MTSKNWVPWAFFKCPWTGSLTRNLGRLPSHPWTNHCGQENGTTKTREAWKSGRDVGLCLCVYACTWALGLTEELAESSQETRKDGYWLAKPSSSSSEPLPQQPANIVQMAEQLEWMDPYKHVLTPGKWQEALPLMMEKIIWFDWQCRILIGSKRKLFCKFKHLSIAKSRTSNGVLSHFC